MATQSAKKKSDQKGTQPLRVSMEIAERPQGYVQVRPGETKKSHASVAVFNPDSIRVKPIIMSGHPGSITHNEEEAFDFISTIGPVIRTMRGYKDGRWNKSTSLGDVIQHHLNALCIDEKRIFKNEQDGWGIEALVPTYFKSDALLVPVDYIEVLEKTDVELFDLLFYMLVWVYKGLQAHMWEDSIDGGFVYERLRDNLYQAEEGDGWFESEDEQMKAEFELKEELKRFDKSSYPSKLYWRIHKAGFSLKLWKQALAALPSDNEVRRAFKSWFTIAVPMMEQDVKMSYFVWNPWTMKQEPSDDGSIMPFETCRFCWSRKGVAFDEIVSFIEASQHECGSLPFYSMRRIVAGSNLNQGVTAHPMAEQIMDFFEFGEHLYYSLANKHYPKGLLAPKKKRKPLIEIL